MWAVQYRDGLTWETLQTHKFFLEAWLHLRWIQKQANEVPVQIVRRFGAREDGTTRAQRMTKQYARSRRIS